MIKKLALVGVAAMVLSSLSGCGLCLLPCYICAAFADPGSSVSAQPVDEAPLAEVGPMLQQTALKNAVAH